MDVNLLKKMIRNCFYQYNHDSNSIPLSSDEFENFCAKIIKIKENDTGLEIHDIVQDIVYEYLTQQD